MISRKSLMMLAVLAALTGTRNAEAGIITGLFNTGVGATGTPLGFGSGATDTNYTVSGPLSATPVQAIVFPAPVPPVYPTSPASNMITAPGMYNQPIGTYTYTTTFTDSSAAASSISGMISADDSVAVFINGVPAFSTVMPSYMAFTPFTISSGFVTGTNTLTFLVTNIGGPEGLNVVFTGMSVPEPASIAMLGLGLGGLAVAARRRRNA